MPKMLKKLDISRNRALFWLVFIGAYWMLFFSGWTNTRHRIYVLAGLFDRFLNSRALSAFWKNLAPLEAEAWTRLADSGSLPALFLAVPVVLSLSLLFAPFLMRKDYDVPVRGVIMLPLATFLCYCFASLFNCVLAAGLTGGIYWHLQIRPGPDFFLFMVSPLNLAYPIMKNIPGFLSQCLYLVFIASVLTIPARVKAERTQEVEVAESWDGRRQFHEISGRAAPGSDVAAMAADTDRAACLMEMDRLCRIIGEMTAQPSLAHAVRSGIADYIDEEAELSKSLRLGKPPYQIILFEAVRSLQRILSQEGNRRGALDALLYVVNETEKMEYITKKEASIAREHLLDLVGK